MPVLHLFRLQRMPFLMHFPMHFPSSSHVPAQTPQGSPSLCLFPCVPQVFEPLNASRAACLTALSPLERPARREGSHRSPTRGPSPACPGSRERAKSSMENQGKTTEKAGFRAENHAKRPEIGRFLRSRRPRAPPHAPRRRSPSPPSLRYCTRGRVRNATAPLRTRNRGFRAFRSMFKWFSIRD